MVLIHYKKVETNQFLAKFAASTPVEDVIKELREINNLRIILDKLAEMVEDLAMHGPIKHEELRGLVGKETLDGALDLNPKLKEFMDPPKMEQGMRFNEDKTAFRWGIILNENTTNIMLQEVDKAKKYISKEQVLNKVDLTLKELKNIQDCLRGAVMVGYPGYHGLRDFEPCREILEGNFNCVSRTADAQEYFEDEKCDLWWAGKQLFPGKLLSDYTGKNEKTKIIVRLQKAGSQAPVREPGVDEETHKKMLAFYYKKQEEAKKLEEDNEDMYMNSPWANPNQLKQQLHGASGTVQWRPR